MSHFRLVVAAAAMLVAASAAAEPVATEDIIRIDTENGAVAGVSVGMSEADVLASGYPMRTWTRWMEGDAFTVHSLNLADDVEIDCLINSRDATVYRISSKSSRLRDQHGLGVGSLLTDLQTAYPDGEFIHGWADGAYAVYVTGTRLYFDFDTADLAESCFDASEACPIPAGLAVASVRLN